MVLVVVGALLNRRPPKPSRIRTAAGRARPPSCSIGTALRRHVGRGPDLVREYQIRFGGGVHDGFRLSDDGSVIPPYLRAVYALTSARIPAGQPAPAQFVKTGHRWSLTSLGTFPTGDHRAELAYRVTGAARPTDQGWEVRVRLLNIAYQPGDPVTIEAESAQPRALELGCVTYAPDSRPCGERHGSRLTYAVPAGRATGVPPSS